MSTKKYDVCLSFAGEDRDYVRQVASYLQRSGVKYFYDEDNQAEFWGKNLQEHLLSVYRDDSRYAVLFISEAYVRKPWAVHERRAALEEALENFQTEYVLPCRFDDTPLNGLHRSISYIDLRSSTPAQLADLIIKKLVLSNSVSLPPESFWKVSSASPERIESTGQNICISVSDERGPVPNAAVLLLAERGTSRMITTDKNGAATFTVPNRELSTILIGKQNYYGYCLGKFDPMTDVEVKLQSFETGGSCIFSSWGSIPELGGMFIVQDSSFIAFKNLTLNSGQSRIYVASDGTFPAFEVEDPDGNRAVVRILHHGPQNDALIQYHYSQLPNKSRMV
jgi:hypothetical protein